MLSDEVHEFESELAKRLGVDPRKLREYLFEVVDEALWRDRPKSERRTGLRERRGTHGVSYVRDAAGGDPLPPGFEPPPAVDSPA